MKPLPILTTTNAPWLTKWFSNHDSDQDAIFDEVLEFCDIVTKLTMTCLGNQKYVLLAYLLHHGCVFVFGVVQIEGARNLLASYEREPTAWAVLFFLPIRFFPEVWFQFTTIIYAYMFLSYSYHHIFKFQTYLGICL